MEKTYQIEILVPRTSANTIVFLTGISLIRSKGHKNVIEVDGKQIVFGQPIVSIEEVDWLKMTGYAETFPVD